MKKNTILGLLTLLGILAQTVLADQLWLPGKTVHFLSPYPRNDEVIIDYGGYEMTPEAGGWFSYTFPEAQVQNNGFYFAINKSEGGEVKAFGTAGRAVQVGENQFCKEDTKVKENCPDDQPVDAGNPYGEKKCGCPSVFGNSDEAWIMEDPVTGLPKISNTAPRYLHVLNPEDWVRTAPMIVINGEAAKPMFIGEECGWFTYMFTGAEDPQSVYFEDVISKEAFGADFGYGDPTPWNISAEFERLGTNELWLEAEDGFISATFPDVLGECSYSMASLVYDHPESHPDFEGGPANCAWPTAQGIMVESYLGPDRKPISKNPSCVNRWDWFDNNAALEVLCRDIPFSKTADGLWEYDSFNEPSGNYFPIDDASDPSIQTSCVAEAKDPDNLDLMDPHDVGGDDYVWKLDDASDQNGPHNFYFCMETHATFVYRPGQVFSFRGDDDVWVYINDELVIDLGGTHVALPSYVELDDLGLTDGQTYNFDFFMCERAKCGSNLRIKSSIYFEQKKGLFFNKTPGATGDTYEVCKMESGGGSCEALLNPGETEKETCGTGLSGQITYTLITSKGDTVDLPSKGIDNGVLEPGQVYLGGIDLTNEGYVVYNEEAIRGLAPGRYRLIVSDAANPSLKEKITIRVAGNLAIVGADIPVDTVAGALVPVVIGSVTSDGEIDYEAGEQAYSLSIPAGLQVFKDAKGTMPVEGNEQLSTNASTGLDTIWVTGTRAIEKEKETYMLNIYRSKGGDKSLTFHLPSLQTVTAKDDFTPLADPTVNWPKSLFTTNSNPVYIEAHWNGHCGVCNDTLWLTPSDSNMTFKNEAKAQTDFVVMKDGIAVVYVSGKADLTDASFTATGPSSLITVTVTGINLTVPPVAIPETALMYDVNGDGIGDSLWIKFTNYSVIEKPLDSLRLWWPLILKGDETIDSVEHDYFMAGASVSNQVIDADGWEIAISNPEGFSEGIYTGETGQVLAHSTFVYKDPETGEDVTDYAAPDVIVQERISPMIREARIRISEKNAFDELILIMTEPVFMDSSAGLNQKDYQAQMLINSFQYIMYRTTVYRDYNFPAIQSTLSGDTITLFVPNSGELKVAAGDSIRLAAVPGAPLDQHGLSAHPNAPYVIIQGEKRSEVESFDKPVLFNPGDPEWAKIVAEEGPTFYDRVGMYVSVEDLVTEIYGRPGFLIKDDMREIYEIAKQMDIKYPDLKPEDIEMKYTWHIYSNLGTFVAKEQEGVNCTDDVFNGDCTQAANNGYLFLGWNMADQGGRAVGTGAYVVKLDKKVTVQGKTWKPSKKDFYETWGVHRSTKGYNLKRSE